MIGSTPIEQQNKFKMDDMLPLAEKGDAQNQFALAKCYEYPSSCRMPAADQVRIRSNRVKQEKARQDQSIQVFTKLNTDDEYKEKALFWYQKAFDQGYEPAMAVLSSAYNSGSLGLPLDLEKARKIALELLERGSPKAFYLMAQTTPKPKGKEDIIYYAWRLVEEAANIEGKPKVIPYYKGNLSDEDLAAARVQADQYINEYLSLYGKKRQ